MCFRWDGSADTAKIKGAGRERPTPGTVQPLTLRAPRWVAPTGRYINLLRILSFESVPYPLQRYPHEAPLQLGVTVTPFCYDASDLRVPPKETSLQCIPEDFEAVIQIPGLSGAMPEDSERQIPAREWHH